MRYDQPIKPHTSVSTIDRTAFCSDLWELMGGEDEQPPKQYPFICILAGYNSSTKGMKVGTL